MTFEICQTCGWHRLVSLDGSPYTNLFLRQAITKFKRMKSQLNNSLESSPISDPSKVHCPGNSQATEEKGSSLTPFNRSIGLVDHSN